MNTPDEDLANQGESVLEKFESLWETTPEPDLGEFLMSHGLTDLATDEQHTLLLEILSIDLERCIGSLCVVETSVRR